MKFKNILTLGSLALTFFVLISLILEVNALQPTGELNLPNKESDFGLIKTEYGNFPVTIEKITPLKDGTELSFIILNPYMLNFAQAEFSVEVNGVLNRETLDIRPNINKLKMKVGPIDRGEQLKLKLLIEKIYFK